MSEVFQKRDLTSTPLRERKPFLTPNQRRMSDILKLGFEIPVAIYYRQIDGHEIDIRTLKSMKNRGLIEWHNAAYHLTNKGWNA